MVISLNALIITIICSILWGVFDGLRKHLTAKASLISILFYLSVGFSLFFFITVFIEGIPEWNNAYLLPGLLTIIFNAAANFFYIKAISISPISNTVPFLAFTTLFTALTGFIFLGEALTFIQIIGVVILVGGSLIINGDLDKTRSLKEEFENLWHCFLKEKGAHYMILVSFLWALSAPFDKLAINAMSITSHGFIESTAIGLVYLIYLVTTKQLNALKEGRTVPVFLSLGSLVYCGALSLQFYGYLLMKVSVFESIKRGFALFTAVLISVIFFKEKVTKLKLIGISLIVAAGALILNG